MIVSRAVYLDLTPDGRPLATVQTEWCFTLPTSASSFKYTLSSSLVTVLSLISTWQQWYVFPPAHSFYTATPTLEMLLSADDSDLFEKAIQFTQHGGDVVYLPALWGHATLNVSYSIGVAYEFGVDDFPL